MFPTKRVGSAALAVCAATTLGALSAQAAPPPPTQVSGQVTYLGKAGTPLPARKLAVDLIDADGSKEGKVVAVGSTDATGRYRLKASTLRPDGKPRRLFVRAQARRAGVHVYNPGATQVYRIDSTPRRATGAPQTVNLAPKGAVSDHNGAFAVADALSTGVDFANAVAWGKVPGVRVLFPDPKSNYLGGTMRLAAADRFDWDVILHEYGHHMAQKLSVSPHVGGSHTFFTNLSITKGKPKGIRMAWSEGVATWLSITAQQHQNVAALGIPNAGDLRYDDPEKGWAVDIASASVGTSVGEDDESAVARTLWRFENDADIGIGRSAVLAALRATKPATLSGALPALMTASAAAPFGSTDDSDPLANAKTNQVACRIADYGYAPRLLSPLDRGIVYSEPPTLEWKAAGAGPAHPLKKFTAHFWDESFTTRLYSSPPLTGTTWVPSQSQWQEVLDAKDSAGATPQRIQVVISGSGVSPITGPYGACAQTQLRPEVTAVPAAADGLLRPPAYGACRDLETTGDLRGGPGVTVTAARLRPSTDYELILHREAEDHPDVLAFTVTSDASGSIAATTKDIPAMPGALWQLRLREKGDPQKYVDLPDPLPVHSYVCYTANAADDWITIDSWGGMGAKPHSTVSVEWWGNGQHTALADADGNYAGAPHTIACHRQWAVVGIFTLENLDGTAQATDTAYCAARKSSRGAAIMVP